MASINTSIPHVNVIWIAFLLFFGSVQLCLCFSGNSSKSGSCIERERKTLLSIQKGIYDAHKWLSWNGNDCCRWRGVRCDPMTGHVVKLDLHYPYPYDVGYPYDKHRPNRSEISLSLLHLRHLKYLDLSMNNFNGAPIPDFIGSLANLEYLNLSNAGFGGTIPHQLGNLSNLVRLDLASSNWYSLDVNNLGWLAQIPSLQHLDMCHVNLSKASNWIHVINMLPSLSKLYLFGASLSILPSTLPLVNFTSLTTLELSGNYFASSIPSWLFNVTSLEHLRLGFNQFHGNIPESIENLHNLSELYLFDNQISGEMPGTVGNLCNLSYFDASNNYLSGPLPKQIGKLSALSHLDLSSNSLAGALTEAHFANLTSLSTLDLSHNSLTVNVSQDWLPPFQAHEIHMSSCPLGPKFPPWLRNQTDLCALDLSSAGILENFPDWFWHVCPTGMFVDLSLNHIEGKLPTPYNSSILVLAHNRFSGSIPSTFCEANDLQVLNLAGNDLSGILPDCWNNTSILLLAHNRFSGSIPSAFCEANDLQVLNLADNDLSGALPVCWNNSFYLAVIDFSDNKLSGGIPSSMGSLRQLSSLHLRSTNLSGKIPLSLQQCKQLVTLDLGNNELSGSIPEWIGESLSSLKVLRLRSNILDGNIPMQLSLLASLQVLDLADNKLSGTLPPSFGNFSAMIVILNGREFIPYESRSPYCTENVLITTKGEQLTFTTVLSFVTSIDLSNNDISGEIPEEFTNLHGIYSLNLSRNHLTGRIPKNIGAMGQLESLDLSMNKLSGAIPTSISNLNSLEHLNLSHNNLSGRFPNGNQLQTLINDPSIYIGNQYLCGLPLLEKCPGDEPAKGPTAHGGEEKQDENENDSEMIWFYVSLSPGFVVGFWGFLGAVMLKRNTRLT